MMGAIDQAIAAAEGTETIRVGTFAGQLRSGRVVSIDIPLDATPEDFLELVSIVAGLPAAIAQQEATRARAIDRIWRP